MTRADAIPPRYGHPISYFKTAYGLILLREDILGPDRFDPAFRKFIRDWAYKHPKPSDFFRAMESEGGEDLAWFWRGWFFEQLAARPGGHGVTYDDGDPAKGAQIAVANLGQLVLPATLRVTFKDGTTRDIAHAGRDLDPVGRAHASRWTRPSRSRAPCSTPTAGSRRATGRR